MLFHYNQNNLDLTHLIHLNIFLLLSIMLPAYILNVRKKDRYTMINPFFSANSVQNVSFFLS
jgi:hypothetical protein